MVLNFSRYFDFLNVNSLKAVWVGAWESLAIFIFTEYGGNLALKGGTNVAQLRLEHQTRGNFDSEHFRKILSLQRKREVQP